MKNIFKKNQIIITALAIMIVIAGYLSFTNNDNLENPDVIETANPDLEEYDALLELEGTELETDAETTEVEDATVETDANAIAADVDEETIPVDTEEDVAGELVDISDEDILATAQDVADNGELDLEDEEVVGEAVLASTTIDAGYFSSTKLRREQMRARNKETLMEMVESPDISEAAKQDVINSVIALTDIAEKENSTELLLEAKGFDGAVVSINEGKVDVVINAENMTEQQLAIIEDTVSRKTAVAVNNIIITPAVVGE